MAGGLAAPQGFPIRSLTDPKQRNGRIVNPPRFEELGGLDSASKLPAGSDWQKVEKPTSVGKVKPDFESTVKV